jgi:hypothetical protein
MAHPMSFLAGAGFGAGAMYLFDPQQGGRRRALLRDQLIHGCTKATKAADVVQRDAANRLYGTMAELRAVMRRDETSDDVLIARVRAKIGRCVSHPAAIEVDAANGRVRLSGPILADEVEGLVSSVERVRGVQSVESSLDIHNEPGNVSALQGGRRRTGEPIDLLQENWSPTTRAAVGAAGFGLMATCLGNRTPIGILLGTIGFGLSARALANAGVRGNLRRDLEIGRQAHPSATTRQTAVDGGNGGNYSKMPEVTRASSPMQAGDAVTHDL